MADKGRDNSKKRQYSDDYIEYGFTSININGAIKLQCVLCYKVLAESSLNPSKLRRHFEQNHPTFVGKDRKFFKSRENNLKKRRLDTSGDVQQGNKASVLHPSKFLIEFSKQKAHTIGESLILPCAKDIVKTILGDQAAYKLNSLSISNDTVRRRIQEMSADINEMVISEIKELFSPTR